MFALVINFDDTIDDDFLLGSAMTSYPLGFAGIYRLKMIYMSQRVSMVILDLIKMV